MEDAPTENIPSMSDDGMVIYMRAQMIVAFGHVNKWFAGIALGHSPSDSEAMRHWITSGAAKRWRNEYFSNNKGNHH
ncbi:MAG: hypothetical protein HQ402_01550 [Parcubacteria group bacterium]|nr:hypothetical protein [Parcubacteria group bacterium]